MSWRMRTKGDVWRFSAVISIIALVGGVALRFAMLPPDLAARTLVPGSVITVLLAAPIAWVVGCRMREVHRIGTRLEHAINHDLLTGVHTRKAFYEHTGPLSAGACAVVVTDIDNFKGFNDCYGHFAGDQALRQFAAILTANCREADIVARFGGEEFVIVLRDAVAEEGLAVAERLAARIRATAIYHGAHTLHLTASFGVAALPPGGDMDIAIQQADRALYRAKNAGRDRACLYDPGRDNTSIPLGTAAE